MDQPITLADIKTYQDLKDIRRDCRFYQSPVTSVIDLGRCRARKKLREMDREEPIPHNRPSFTQSGRVELF